MTTGTWIFTICWIIVSIINWFAINGYNNNYFKQHSKYDESIFWIILSTVFTGFGGFITNIVAGRCHKFSWRPLTTNQKEQILMLRKLEDADPYGGNEADINQAIPAIMGRAKRVY